MPVTQQQIEEARTSSQAAGQQAIDFASKSSQVQQELEQALKGNLTDSGLVEKRSQALADYQAAPAESRNMYGNTENESFIFNPYARDALIQRNVAQARIPYSSLSDYFSLATQSIPETVNAYGNQYANQANALAQAAQLQRQGYGDLLSEYQMQQDEAYRQQQLALERAKLDGGGGGIGSILSMLMGGGGSAQPTEPQPQYTPMQNGETSPGGEWQFQDTKWVPTGVGQTSSGFDFGAIDTSDPRNMLALAALGQADSPSEILAATNVLFPADNQTSKRVIGEKLTAYDTAERQIRDALAYVKGGTLSTGENLPAGLNVSGWQPLAGLRKSGLLPKRSADRVAFETILANLAGVQAFGEAGKALTEVEKNLVQGKIPEATTTEKELETQLQSILSDLEAKRNELLFQQVGL